MTAWTRKNIVLDAIASWQERELITPETAAVLTADALTAQPRFAFRNILILLAVICLGFAAMTFVAANWDEMARLSRVVAIFAAMWVFWGASAFFNWRGQSWFTQVFILGACGMFGAGIMLISQIYHIQGSAKDATWMWAVGTLFAAAVTRSAPALALSITLLTAWLWIEPNIFSWRSSENQLTFPLYLIACSALAYWMHNRFSAHLIVLSAMAWVVPTALNMLADKSASFAMFLIGASFVLLSVLLLFDRGTALLRGFERPLLLYLFVTIGVVLAFWGQQPDITRANLEKAGVYTQAIPPAILAILATIALAVYGLRHRTPNIYDLVATAIFTILSFGIMIFLGGHDFIFFALLLAGSIWIIRMGWRLEFRPLTVLGFLAFSIVMIWVYAETIGSLLGTSVFYGGIGVLLLAAVFIIPRLSRTVGKPS